MPPPAAAEVAVAQFVVLVLLVLVLLALLELDELQAAVSTTPLAIAAVTASSCLARTISLPTIPEPGKQTSQILARQVEMMTSQDKREVSRSWRPGSRSESDW
jgi:hypothetical protein